jgi:glycosyltransferase involved in cell wall biosynthesis
MHARSAAAVCATHQAQEVLRQKGYTKPTRVIPYGIPEFFFQADASSPDPNRPFTIGFIGRLLPMKGIDLLLDALEHLPGARLLMVGDGEEKETYQAQCKQNEQAARVEWIPPQPEENIPGLLARMDVLVLPSRRVHGWQEQLGRVLIEAMAVGVPVVGSTSGAIPEVIGDAGLVFQENDAGDLAAVLRRLMDNPGQRDYYKTLGRKRAESRFTWPRFAKELIDFHRTLVSDS